MKFKNTKLSIEINIPKAKKSTDFVIDKYTRNLRILLSA